MTRSATEAPQRTAGELAARQELAHDAIVHTHDHYHVTHVDHVAPVSGQRG